MNIVINNMKITIGSIFFALCLLFIYIYKSKELKKSNRIFRLLLIMTIITLITEVAAIISIYYNNTLGNLNIVEEIASRSNLWATIIWIFCVITYTITLEDKIENKSLKYYIKNDKYTRLLFILIIAIFIISSLTKFNNICDEKGAYLNGAPMYFLYIYGVVAVIIGIIHARKTRKIDNNEHNKGVLICSMAGFAVMASQLMDKYILLITAYFTFVCYVLYFIHENPDLFVVKKLVSAKNKVVKSNLAKTDFLTNMSHEIRFPISTILGLSEGVVNLNNIEWNNIKEDVYHINSSGENLLEIINNILDVSKIESGDDILDNREYSLGSIIYDIKSIAQAKITSNDVSFVINMDKNIPTTLIGDKNKVYQILLNLVNNAIRFTNEGKIIVNVTSELKDGRAHLFFKVSDTGTGIKEEKQKEIQESFNDIGIAAKKENKKTELGLVITNNLTKQLGGSFKFESVYGAGSTFYADVWQNVLDMTPLGDYLVTIDNIKKTKKLDCTGYNVLLVDDDRLSLKVAEKKLEDYHFTTTSCTSGKECINTIKKEEKTFDLIILDHVMKDIDGIELLHVLKSLDTYKIPPIVMLTANALSGMKDSYITEGFDDYLSKPINNEELNRIINKLFKAKIEQKESERNKNIKEIENETQNKDHKKDNLGVKYLEEAGIDYKSAMNYIGDIDSYNNTLQDYINDIDGIIKEINLSRIKKDYEKYTKVIHDLRSNTKSIGLNNLYEKLSKHEKASNDNDLEYINDNIDDLILDIKKNKSIIEKYLKIKN